LRGPGAGSPASRRRCRTDDAGCTAVCRPEHQKNKNAFKHGRYCAEAVARRRSIAELIKKARELAATRNLGTVSSSIFDLNRGLVSS
jgi:hypothetical protein